MVSDNKVCSPLLSLNQDYCTVHAPTTIHFVCDWRNNSLLPKIQVNFTNYKTTPFSNRILALYLFAPQKE